VSTTTLRSAVTRTPHTTAVVFDKEEVSYADLHRRANQLAHYLQAMGVGPDVLVGVLLDRSVETIVTLLAIFKAGGAYVPLDPEYPDERLRFMMRDAGLELVVTQAKLTSRLGDTVVQSIRVDADWAEIANESQDNPPLLASASNLAYIIYTSGSTGTPKGAMVTRGGMLNCLQWMQQRYELTKQDAFLMHTSLNFDSSVWEVFWPLLAGVRLVIAPADMLESSALLRYIAEQSVSCAFFVPSQLGMLVQEPGLSEMTSLRYVITGGEKLPLGVMREFQELSRAELHNAYGPTETAIAATEWTCEAGAERVLIGRPIGNTQVYVLNEQMEPLPVGVEGELYIGGAGVGRGYAGQAELTAARFVPHPFSSKPGARLYRTGDLVRYDAAGQLEFVDRVDQQVKVRGSRIELGEIEAVLQRHAQVSEAVVVLNEADGDKRLVAYVVSEAEAGALREYLQAQLPGYMVPAFFVALNDLPLLPNGKLNRSALPAPEGMVLAETEYVAPRTATEELLAGLWARVLRVNRVGINDNFFALGGHSLLAVRLMAQIQASFGQHLPVASLFQAPTIEKLASLLHEQPHDYVAFPLVAIQPNGEGLPFFCVHPVGGNVLCYNELSNHLGFERPFYGLQARGLAENQIPYMRIEDMAAYYLDAIRTVRPDGPYLLGGWSMGGVIAYEMAQQLEGQGQQVSLLALMDARPVTSVDDAAPLDELTLLSSFARDLGLPVDGLQLSTDELAQLDSDELLSYVLQRAIDAGIIPGDIQLAHARRLFEVFKINVQALQSYRPEASSTRVTLLKAGEQEVADETMGWGALTSGEIEIHQVPGNHFTIVREPNVRSLAEQLADCINRATLRSLASHT